MYNHREFNKRFICIDVDPYGCAGPFLDGAVQAILDGGLLMVTATDLAILCGNNSETCFAKYGSVSLRIAACHEMVSLYRNQLQFQKKKYFEIKSIFANHT